MSSTIDKEAMNTFIESVLRFRIDFRLNQFFCECGEKPTLKEHEEIIKQECETVTRRMIAVLDMGRNDA